MTMTTRLQQMASHGVDAAKHPFASFCFGRGWRGHATAAAAWESANRDARRVAKNFGGGYPPHFVARTDTGETVQEVGNG
jgi:hypothetical protein